ncbi:MAG: gamma-glutamyl-gamma-aminobutyrate hydrolase family protein [Sedimentisphaerales bacterium]|nr:gamma-glutamyl-gamma-aminobutyrate hydrolase family protein [Sedimentisphaerales bacterium]
MRTKLLICIILLLSIAGGCAQSRSNRAPLIGITSTYQGDDQQERQANVQVSFAYVAAVREAGGVPLILPTVDSPQAIEQYLKNLDGLLLIGGADIPPAAYHQQPHPTVEVMSQHRWNFERKLIKDWFESGKPLLGVCLGMQFTNVVRGGTMIQDIPSQVGTQVIHRGNPALHKVTIEPSSRLHKILATDQPVVYSAHHQAVDKIGHGLKIVAHSDDGIVEALERTDDAFGLFVQWHPEKMDNPALRKPIYKALIDACRAQSKNK